tara:strand:- start:5233 stop:6123 length:891 start_codon:yes stop_codon:yes gene_type:complete
VILSKLVLGGANFGQTYGIDRNKIKLEEINKILSYLKKKNKKIIIDSSPNYKNCEKILKNLKYSNFLIITKIKGLPKRKIEIKKFIENFIYRHKKKTKKNIYAILLHDEFELSNIKRLRFIIEILNKIKRQGIIKKYGFSIYNYTKYKKNILKMKPDILQFPLNIVDDRINKVEFEKLKKKKISLHARSVFLQGLLLKNQKYLPKRFKKLRKVWQEYDERCFSSNSNKLETCLGEVLSNSYINKIVIGFNSFFQFKEIEKIKKTKKKFIFPNLSKNQKTFLINPYKWKNDFSNYTS